MNLRTFLKEFESSPDRDRMVDAVYDEFAHYCRENDIGEDDISTPVLRRLAEGFVERGFGLPPSEETVTSDVRYLSEADHQALDDMQKIDPELITELKRLSRESEDHSWTEELGTATDGSELDQ